ncbi:amidohydrolase family protein [Sphingomonas sp. KR1UV-12]|uniref:Amidohydrolase family protein n=1 Tax=Sphingomonas aurea TaxID=3063994 RepID=A0ABT9EL05_9SPHN|nr:amidohydrolase family protein [Sphingomonas sp. KR1UV-12]MDP1027621.1 amidohydrolase family protein [Sphingomonas sp. KR1UV-12]
MTRRIDAHHHLWTAGSDRHPMLDGPPVERFWGNSAELVRDYPVDIFAAQARATGVVASVYVEAGFAPADEEARVVQAIAKTHGFPHAILTRIDLADPDAGARIAADAACANWRGIRVTAPAPFDDPQWRRGLAALSAAGGVADLMVWPGQLDAVAALARAMPDAAIVIEHLGMADGDPLWAAGMAALADCGNVSVKLSGAGLVRRDWSADTVRPVIARLLALFGAERLMWGSNAPVDLVMADYPTIVARFDDALADRSAAERRAIWHDTAERVYRIGAVA